MHGLNYENGRYCFTRAAGTEAAWHRLGGETPADAPIEVWMKNAGMDFKILKLTSESQLASTKDAFGNIVEGKRIKGVFTDSKGVVRDQFSNLVHSRSEKILDQVGADYEVHQPEDIARMFRQLCENGGFTMDTMGVLDGGRRYWGLASNSLFGSLKVNDRDIIKPFLLLATGCGMATTAQLTTVRVVCQNTLHFSLARGGAIRQRHTSAFNPELIAEGLGLEGAFEVHMDTLDRLASEKVDHSDALTLVLDLFASPAKVEEFGTDLIKYPTRTKNTVKKIVSLFNGDAKGSFSEQRGSKIQLLNSITEFVDHHQSRKGAEGVVRDGKRTDAIWFGSGASTKATAFQRLAYSEAA